VILEDEQLKNLADEHGASVEALRDLLAELRAQAGADQFYVFWMAGRGSEQPGARRRRTLLAFLTPDAALVFAQRNQLTAPTRPRLRRLFVADLDTPPPQAGQLPRGVRVERADLLRRLRPYAAI
jgi:hypothetical protein